MLRMNVLRLIWVTSFMFASVTSAQETAPATAEVDAETDVDVTPEKIQSKANADEATVAETADQSEADEKKEPKFFRKLKEKSDTDIDTRLFAYYRFSDVPGAQNQFKLDTARLNLSVAYGRAVEAVLKYDFADTANGHDVEDGVRDAYVRVEPVRAFGVQMGQFKKPFGGLELTSRGKLPSITRGEANDYAEYLHFGGRDVGAMISGRLIKSIDLDYYAGIFNGDGPGDPDLVTPSLDYAFRLEVEPVEWLKIGAAASAHAIREDEIANVDKDFEPGDPMEYDWLAGRHWMGELDVKFEFGNFEAMFETMLGQNWWYENSPYLWSLASVMSYKVPLFGGVMAIEPVIFAEMLDIEDPNWAWRVRMMQLSPGVNVHFGDDVRLMIHGQLVKTIGGEDILDETPVDFVALDIPGEWPGEFAGYKNLFIQLAFAN